MTPDLSPLASVPPHHLDRCTVHPDGSVSGSVANAPLPWRAWTAAVAIPAGALGVLAGAVLWVR